MIDTIRWRDNPSTETPINAENLNKVPISFAREVFEEVSEGVFSNRAKEAEYADRATNADAAWVGGIPVKSILVPNSATNVINTERATDAEHAIDAVRVLVAESTLLPHQEKFYDVTVRTQKEFNDLLASNNWFDAKTVALVGSFTINSPEFTSNSSDPTVFATIIKIPKNVEQVDGFNNATININNPINKSGWSNLAIISPDPGEWNLPPSQWETGTKITGISIKLQGKVPPTASEMEVFRYFRKVSNCTATVQVNGMDVDNIIQIRGFSRCFDLNNCASYLIENYPATSGRRTVLTGFGGCTNLVDCFTRLTSISIHARLIGYLKCSMLSNCSLALHIGEPASGYGFADCDYLSNCSSKFHAYKTISPTLYNSFSQCRQLSNCLASPDGGVAYFNCSYGSNNSFIGTGTPTGGTMTKWSSETNNT